MVRDAANTSEAAMPMILTESWMIRCSAVNTSSYAAKIPTAFCRRYGRAPVYETKWWMRAKIWPFPISAGWEEGRKKTSLSGEKKREEKRFYRGDERKEVSSEGKARKKSSTGEKGMMEKGFIRGEREGKIAHRRRNAGNKCFTNKMAHMAPSRPSHWSAAIFLKMTATDG